MGSKVNYRVQERRAMFLLSTGYQTEANFNGKNKICPCMWNMDLNVTHIQDSLKSQIRPKLSITTKVNFFFPLEIHNRLITQSTHKCMYAYCIRTNKRWDYKSKVFPMILFFQYQNLIIQSMVKTLIITRQFNQSQFSVVYQLLTLM